MGNPPKITKWRTDGDPGRRSQDWRKESLILVVVGKRGKMEE